LYTTVEGAQGACVKAGRPKSEEETRRCNNIKQYKTRIGIEEEEKHVRAQHNISRCGMALGCQAAFFPSVRFPPVRY